ncbi:MAG TPA: hypothetical protein VES88_17535 [Gemmatimonadaceae bacterium]|nr:hypothetical protein [Gemmatimonadaceae bacterium]
MKVHKLRLLLLGAVGATACVEVSNKSPATDTTISRATPAVSATSVNQGTYGMRSRIRWILSPDSSAILVMVDPVSIENDPLPNAFFFGSETRNFQTRMDNVWDVAPAPDWQSLAFSRAYVVRSPNDDLIPAADWIALARTTGMDTATVIQGSFNASGMTTMRAIAQPGIIRVPADIRAPGATDAAAPRMFPIARGWRVRWTVDGTTIALGNNPARVEDDEGSESWAALDPKTNALHGTLPAGARLAVPRWKDGPVLESGTAMDLEGGNPVDVTAGKRSFSIESQRGVITARETTPGVSSDATPFTIGSGRALVSTRGGRYIVALAPRRNAVANEIPFEAVVYTVAW